MITEKGRDVIKRFFGGQINQIGGTIAFGVGVTPPSDTDASLDYEVLRTNVNSVNGDLANSRTVFKGRIEPGQIKRIYEVGLYESTQVATLSRMLSLFGTGGGQWSNGVLDATFARAGATALRVDYVANGSPLAEISGMNEDLSAYTDADQLVLGVHATSDISSIQVRLGTDADNYFQYTFSDLDLGYNILKAVRSTATITGSPTWESIQYVAFRVNATASADGSAHFDGMRIEQQASGQLVARRVLATPIDVDTDITSDVEYALRIAFT